MARKKLTNDAVVEALLEEIAPSRAAKRLGVHRNTITNMLKDPELQRLLREERNRAAQVAGAALTARAADLVENLIALAMDSGPRDSVKLGATIAGLKMISQFAMAADKEGEDRDLEWTIAPRFEPRLVGADDAA